MKVQVLGYVTSEDRNAWYQVALNAEHGESVKYSFGNLVFSSLREPAEFDAFDVNVICLEREGFWKNSENNRVDVVDSVSDLDSIAELASRTKSLVVLALPYDGIRFSYATYPGSRTFKTIPVKDLLNHVQAIAFRAVSPHRAGGSIVYGSGTSIVGHCPLSSFFFLDGAWDEVLTTTESPAFKPTTVNDGGIVVTTLPVIESEEAFAAFLGTVCIGEPVSDIPSWFLELPPVLDDVQYLEEITRQQAIIDNALAEVEKAQSHLRENDKWKSILYANGNQLENVVREMLGELFGWDWQSFEDCGTSDFIFEYKGVCYAGEIKGENSNVTNPHLAQLDLNLSIDEEAERVPKELPCRKLLIANTFRKKPPAERPPVDEKQIELARDKYGCLIVTTQVLLELFGAIRKDEITLQYLEELLSKRGILEMSDITDIANRAK